MLVGFLNCRSEIDEAISNATQIYILGIRKTFNAKSETYNMGGSVPWSSKGCATCRKRKVKVSCATGFLSISAYKSTLTSVLSLV